MIGFRIGVLSFFVLLRITNASAQEPPKEKIEADLEALYSKIFPFYYGDQDSLEKYSSLYSAALIKFIKNDTSTLDFQFTALNSCSIVTSADGLFRIYSWDTEMGGTMHLYNSIYQYRSNEKVFIDTASVGGEKSSSGFYSDIFTLQANNKTYYLAINNGSESSALGYQAVDILAIEDDVLNDTVKLIKTDHGFTNYIMVEYSNWSVVDWSGGAAKLIKYDPKMKIIYIPIILEDGKVTNRYILY